MFILIIKQKNIYTNIIINKLLFFKNKKLIILHSFFANFLSINYLYIIL